MFYDESTQGYRIDPEDQCHSCAFFHEDDDDMTRCPLISALTQCLVTLDEPVTLEGCKIHVPYIS